MPTLNMNLKQNYAIDTRDARVVENLARLIEKIAPSCGLHVPDRIIGSTSEIPRTALFDYRLMSDGTNVGRFYYKLTNGSFQGVLDLRSMPFNTHNRLMEQLTKYRRILRPIN